MQVANFGTKHGGEWAPSRRNPGSLFVRPKEKAATRRQFGPAFQRLVGCEIFRSSHKPAKLIGLPSAREN